MTPKQIDTLFQRFKKDNPNPTTELLYASPFELLIAVILSARATDVSVNKVTRKLFPVANTPETILALGENGLVPYIKTIGLYNTKGKNILKTCKILIEHYGSTVPHDRVALENLPGVGRKTANVILNTVFHDPTIAVDTHIFRVSNRLKLATGKTPLEVERGLLKVIPENYSHDAHHWLILHGRYVCKARKPLCYQCIVADLCPYEPKTSRTPPSGTSPD